MRRDAEIARAIDLAGAVQCFHPLEPLELQYLLVDRLCVILHDASTVCVVDEVDVGKGLLRALTLGFFQGISDLIVISCIILLNLEDLLIIEVLHGVHLVPVLHSDLLDGLVHVADLLVKLLLIHDYRRLLRVWAHHIDRLLSRIHLSCHVHRGLLVFSCNRVDRMQFLRVLLL